jgi:hypothetical protein
MCERISSPMSVCLPVGPPCAVFCCPLPQPARHARTTGGAACCLCMARCCKAWPILPRYCTSGSTPPRLPSSFVLSPNVVPRSFPSLFHIHIALWLHTRSRRSQGRGSSRVGERERVGDDRYFSLTGGQLWYRYAVIRLHEPSTMPFY